MNGTKTAEVPSITCGLGLNDITVSTTDCSLGHFSPADGLY